jgi:hypothetical protein
LLEGCGFVLAFGGCGDFRGFRVPEDGRGGAACGFEVFGVERGGGGADGLGGGDGGKDGGAALADAREAVEERRDVAALDVCEEFGDDDLVGAGDFVEGFGGVEEVFEEFGAEVGGGGGG